MPFPNAPTCLKCGALLPIGEAWERSRRPRALLGFRDIGVRCPRCGATFRVIKGPATAAAVAITVLGAAIGALLTVGAVKLFRSDLNDWPVLLFLAAMLLALWVQIEVAPRFCRVRPIEAGESVLFPLD